MAIHKFIRKYPRFPRRPPIAVIWHPHADLDYPPVQIEQFKWQVFAQLDKIIKPHTSMTFQLRFGVEISMGVVLISLGDKLKDLKCSIMNESVAVSTGNIVTAIQNNADKDIAINKGDILCYLTFIAR